MNIRSPKKILKHEFNDQRSRSKKEIEDMSDEKSN